MQVREAARAADKRGGVVLGYGNHAGDVLNVGQAAEVLRAEGIDVRVLAVADDVASASVGPGSAESRASASHLLQLDAVAGDGDHDIGMARGVNAAAEAAQLAFWAGGEVKSVLLAAGEAWSERAGGTSGTPWVAMLIAAGWELGNEFATDGPAVVRSLSEAVRTGRGTDLPWGTAAQEASSAAERTARHPRQDRTRADPRGQQPRRPRPRSGLLRPDRYRDRPGAVRNGRSGRLTPASGRRPELDRQRRCESR